MRGRPNIFQNKNLSDEYLRIYHLKTFLNWPLRKIARNFGCSKSKTAYAIAFVEKNMKSVPPKSLLQGAIFSFKERLRGLVRLYMDEIKKKSPSIQNVCLLNQQIREDEKILLDLQMLYAENFQKEDHPMSAGDVLKIITQRKVVATSPVQ